MTASTFEEASASREDPTMCELCGDRPVAKQAPLTVNGRLYPASALCRECAPDRSSYPGLAKSVSNNYAVDYLADALELTLGEVRSAFGVRAAVRQAGRRARRRVGV